MRHLTARIYTAGSRALLAAALVLPLLLSSCASRQPGGPIQPGFNMYSPQDDIELGQRASAQILQQVEVVNNRALQEYVAAVGQTLAQQPEAGSFPYKFTLILDDTINAFALPGGPVFIHTGLVKNSDNEAQLAGVLAHEIGHVALRHATNQASKAQIAQLPAVLAGVVIGDAGVAAQAARLGLDVGLASILLKYSRDAERQSDILGARLMSRAGYNPMEMANFFEKLQAQGGSRAPEFLSSHPDPGNRAQAVNEEIAVMPKRNYGQGTGRFQQMRAEVERQPRPRRPRGS